MYSEKDSVSEEPWMLMDGPIPSKVIEEMSVTFFLQFLGALPCAFLPWAPFRSAPPWLCWSRTRPRIADARGLPLSGAP